MPQGLWAIPHEALKILATLASEEIYATGSGSPGGSGISKTLSVMETSM